MTSSIKVWYPCTIRSNIAYVMFIKMDDMNIQHHVDDEDITRIFSHFLMKLTSDYWIWWPPVAIIFISYRLRFFISFISSTCLFMYSICYFFFSISFSTSGMRPKARSKSFFIGIIYIIQPNYVFLYDFALSASTISGCSQLIEPPI
jgi:hypothetical protein